MSSSTMAIHPGEVEPKFLQSEEQVNCRIDHYQTRDQVHVTVYAKQVDKNRSSVQVGDDKVDICF